MTPDFFEISKSVDQPFVTAFHTSMEECCFLQGHKQGHGRRKQWFALTVGRNIAAVSAVGLVYVSMEKIGASAKSVEAQVSVSMVDSGVDVKNVVV